MTPDDNNRSNEKEKGAQPDPIQDLDNDVAADDADAVKGGFNPQPEPPGTIRGFNPQPDPPMWRSPGQTPGH
jgi:hypothetical protein